jgi:hypothetical protein
MHCCPKPTFTLLNEQFTVSQYSLSLPLSQDLIDEELCGWMTSRAATG